MTVYVDKIIEYAEGQISPPARRYGNKWCHMWADTTAELDAFAMKMGLLHSWRQNDPRLVHYDLIPSKRALAIYLGAVEASLRDRLQAELRR